MASVELGDMEGIAEQYSNGNLSKFLRDLIYEYHIKHMKQEKIQQNQQKASIIQVMAFIIFGFSLSLFAVSYIIDIVQIALVSVFLLSAILLFIYSGILLKGYYLQKGEKGA